MKNKQFKRPPLRMRRRHMIRQLFNSWPWLVWIAAVIAIPFVIPGGFYRVRFNAEAVKINPYVSTGTDGRISSLTVEMGDTVKAGQVIGQLDSDTLKAELMMDKASLMKTRDKAASIQGDLDELILEQKEAEANLRSLEAQWERTQRLLEEKLVLETDIDNLAPQIEAKRAVLEQYPTSIKNLKERLAIVREEIEILDPDELERLTTSQYLLTAPMDGVIEEVLHRPGEVVEQGEEIVRISNALTSRVTAFMPEAKRLDMIKGDRCRVITQTEEKVYHGIVLSVTASIRKLPVDTGFSDQMLRGRRIVIELTDGQLIPGERVVVVPDISILEQWFGRK